jgi:hypothetical protein
MFAGYLLLLSVKSVALWTINRTTSFAIYSRCFYVLQLIECAAIILVAIELAVAIVSSLHAPRIKAAGIMLSVAILALFAFVSLFPFSVWARAEIISVAIAAAAFWALGFYTYYLGLYWSMPVGLVATGFLIALTVQVITEIIRESSNLARSIKFAVAARDIGMISGLIALLIWAYAIIFVRQKHSLSKDDIRAANQLLQEQERRFINVTS